MAERDGYETYLNELKSTVIETSSGMTSTDDICETKCFVKT